LAPLILKLRDESAEGANAGSPCPVAEVKHPPKSGPSAEANMIYAGRSPAMATDQSLSLNFNSDSPASGLSFILDGYRSLDGKNAYEDDFSLRLNNKQIFLGTFNLGGGSNSGSQANVYSNHFGAT